MEFFKTINDHTRMTYYVLPLIYLNKYSFGPLDNFVNAYIAEDTMSIIVVVKDSTLVPGTPWVSEWLINAVDNKFYFELPLGYREDVQKVIAGQYSKLSAPAKDMIRKHSGLNYDKLVSKNGKSGPVTDARIYALERHPNLRIVLENLLDVRIDLTSELISPPQPSEIWKEKALGN